MPSVLDRIFGRKPKAEEEPLLKEGTMQQVPVEAIKQPEVIEHGIPVEISVKVEETKRRISMLNPLSELSKRLG